MKVTGGCGRFPRAAWAGLSAAVWFDFLLGNVQAGLSAAFIFTWGWAVFIFLAGRFPFHVLFLPQQ